MPKNIFIFNILKVNDLFSVAHITSVGKRKKFVKKIHRIFVQ